jgi:hypothetical protein
MALQGMIPPARHVTELTTLRLDGVNLHLALRITIFG